MCLRYQESKEEVLELRQLLPSWRARNRVAHSQLLSPASIFASQVVQM